MGEKKEEETPVATLAEAPAGFDQCWACAARQVGGTKLIMREQHEFSWGGGGEGDEEKSFFSYKAPSFFTEKGKKEEGWLFHSCFAVIS